MGAGGCRCVYGGHLLKPSESRRGGGLCVGGAGFPLLALQAPLWVLLFFACFSAQLHIFQKQPPPPPKKKDSAIPSLWGARVELDVGVARSGSIFYMHPWPPVLGSLQNRFHFPIRLGSCPPAVPLTTQKWGRQRKWNHCTPRLPKQEVTP